MARGGAKPIKRGKYAERRIGKILRDIEGSTIVKTEAPFTTTQFAGGSVAGGFYGSHGALDFEGGYWGRFVAIEVKRFDGSKQNRWNFKSNVRKHQVERLKEIHDTRGTAAIVLLWDLPDRPSGEPQKPRWFWIPAPAIIQDIECNVKSWTLGMILNIAEAGHITELSEGRPLSLESSIVNALCIYAT